MMTTRFIRSHIRVWLLLLFCCASHSFAATQEIRITAPAENTAFSFSTVLLHGELSDVDADEVRLVNSRTHAEGQFVAGQAYQGRFKVLAPLRRGENELKIRCGDAETTLKLRFEPNENPNFARIVYLTDSSENTEFQMPGETVSQDYQRRLATAMKLMQCMTAERMNDLGYGYRTFNIELDENDEVVVHVVKGEKTAEEYYDLFDNNQFFGQFYQEMNRHFPDETRILLVPAFTRWDMENQRDRGHTAVGGGRLAVFGGATLYCWPTDIETAVAGMIDTTRIDKTIKDDSVGRSVYWACASTCIGASLHELGHAMDLPHTSDPMDIMTRGHDHFFRVFLVREAPSAYTNYERWTDFTPNQMAQFAPPSATALIMSRWFAQDDPTGRGPGRIEMEVEKDRKAVIIRAENGIACTQIISVDDGRIIDFWAPTATQALKNEFQTSDAVSFEKLRQITDAARVRVRVGDAHGFFSAGKTVQIREEPPAPGKQVSQSVPLPKSGDEISYWVFLPAGYDERESWPLMLFVHGSGECGPDIEAVKAHGPPKLLQTDRAENWPMITVSPQCPAGKNWSGSQLIELLDEMEKRFKVDRKSVYVTGLGMGGSATWSLLRDYPNRFAAGVPICAGFVPDSADPFLDTPIWVFHGAKDDFVDPETSRKAVEMIRKQGGTKVKLTMYPDVDHFAWRSAYDEAELYRWLLEQKRDD